MPDVIDRLTAKDVHRALHWHFEGRWAQLTEVTARPKAVNGRYEPDAKHRRIDVLLLRAKSQARPDGGVQQRDDPALFPGLKPAAAASVGDPIERLAIEIKVSRSDFLSDVRNPEKQAPWRALAHRHAYAAPAGMIDEAELPPGSGLISVSRQSWDPRRFTVEWAVRAKRPTGHTPEPLPLSNLMDAFYRAGRAKARLKGYAGLDDDQSPEDMRAELARLKHELELAGNRIDREIEARQHWQQAYGAVGSPPCSTCGHPLRPKRRSYQFEWEHPVPLDASACELLRRAAAERQDLEHPESHRAGRYLYVPAPEPVDIPHQRDEITAHA
jgi:hypothetical protein